MTDGRRRGVSRRTRAREGLDGPLLHTQKLGHSVNETGVCSPTSLKSGEAAKMKPRYEETITHPLTTDALVEERINALVGRACRRQIWFLFLDEETRQLPLIIPVSDPPVMPDLTVPQLIQNVALAIDGLDARSVIVVLERFAEPLFTEADRAWAQAIDAALTATGLPMRAILVSHRRGVRWFAPDDYRWESSK